MIVAVIPVYNSAETIEECIFSLIGRVDKVLCFDGRWEGFPYASPHSDDETEFLINCLKGICRTMQIEYHLLPTLPQGEARTEMLCYVKEGDWILSIDSDEYVIAWEGIRPIIGTTQERGFRVSYTFPIPRCAAPTFRFVKKTKGLRFSTDHRRVFDDNGELDLVHFPVIPITIGHQRESTTKSMRPYMEQYKEWNHKWESEHPV